MVHNYYIRIHIYPGHVCTSSVLGAGKKWERDKAAVRKEVCEGGGHKVRRREGVVVRRQGTDPESANN